MKFFHLSDLHIGKQLHYYSLKEDQTVILDQIVEMARNLKPDAILIAGDVYDKSIPSGEAVTIFDDFLTKLSRLEPVIPILIISGNHDSAERLDYASGILNRHQIHIAGMPPRSADEFIKKVVLTDSVGEVNFYLLPFIKPGYVRNVFEDEIDTYDSAVRKMIEREKLDLSARNVLLSHQFYTAGSCLPSTSDSEVKTVGGLDNVDISAIQGFDYVALGHIHRPQKMGIESIRYCGSPLKYSLSECNDNKCLTQVTLGPKGEPPVIEQLPLVPIRNIREVRGLLEDILEMADGVGRDDYISVTITNEIDPYRPKEQLEEVYSHLLEVKVDNNRTRSKGEILMEVVNVSDPLEVFAQFFQSMQGRDLDEEELQLMTEIVNHAQEAE